VIFAVGPLTNIALLYKLYPEISSKIKALWIMGGNFQGIGNITNCGEFNFWSDPEAAHIVLAESKCPLYIYPWEACLQASKATPLTQWRLKTLSSNQNAITNFMDPIDTKIQIKGNFIPCDSYATACFMIPQMITKMENCHVTVELAGNLTRGQMVIDHKKTEKPNAFVIQEIDAEMFKRFLMWICDHENSNFDV
jgi:inosine-uridine nucleoside N-ribohydrolase